MPRRPIIIVFLTVLLLQAACCAFAQQRNRIGIAYCDLDHLYDTVSSPFYHDDDYTPRGRLHWNTDRYRRKIAQAAAVIDSMRMPVVALWGVENEAVVRDIVTACKGDYSYLHRTLNSLDGMDFALLYYGDVFFPHLDEPGRRYLYIEGTLRYPVRREHLPVRPIALPPTRTDTVGIVLCSDTRMADWIVRDLRRERPEVKLLVLGRTASLDAGAYGLQDATSRAARAGRGNVRSRSGWKMRDRILIDSAYRNSGGDVFARRYLLDEKSGYPVATFDGKRYTGGYGYALPVFVYIE